MHLITSVDGTLNLGLLEIKSSLTSSLFANECDRVQIASGFRERTLVGLYGERNSHCDVVGKIALSTLCWCGKVMVDRRSERDVGDTGTGSWFVCRSNQLVGGLGYGVWGWVMMMMFISERDESSKGRRRIWAFVQRSRRA